MNPSNKMLSVIIPSYNEEAMIQTTFQTVRKILSENMKSAAELSVALEIDLHTGSNWYEAK